MVKNFRSLIVLIFFVLMVVVSWKNVIQYRGGLEKSYRDHINSAEEYMRKEIYVDAVSEYEAALQIKKDDYDLAMTIIDLYQKLDNESSYVKACQNAISIDKTDERAYIALADYYTNDNNMKEAVKTLLQAEENMDGNVEIISRLDKIRGNYTIENMKYESYSNFCSPSDPKTEYAVVGLGDKYGMIDQDLDVVADLKYNSIGLLNQGVIPVCEGGEWFYVDENLYRKLVPDHSSQYLGTFSNGYAPAKFDGKYCYIDKEMKEHDPKTDYAGCFANGIAAVKSGDKWAIINDSLELVTDYIYDDVLMDEFGFCSIYGVYWAKENEQYFLYDTKGNKLSEGYEEVKLFVSEEPAAVKIGDKWGFVSKDGELVIEASYQNANSFSLGYAPYLDNGKWGCIGENGNILIEPTFDSMGSFAQNGYSLVEMDGVKKFAVVNIYD